MSEYTIDCPPGLYRLFLSSGTQAAFDLRSDEDITQEDNLRHVPKQTILDDMVNKQVLSDFSPLRKQIEDYPEDEIVVVYDYEFQHDKNFYICLSPSLKEIILNVIINFFDLEFENFLIFSSHLLFCHLSHNASLQSMFLPNPNHGSRWALRNKSTRLATKIPDLW